MLPRRCTVRGLKAKAKTIEYVWDNGVSHIIHAFLIQCYESTSRATSVGKAETVNRGGPVRIIRFLQIGYGQ